MKSKKYSKEFKEESLRIAERDGVTAACEKFGLKKHHIYVWRRAKRLLTDSVERDFCPVRQLNKACDRAYQRFSAQQYV